MKIHSIFQAFSPSIFSFLTLLMLLFSSLSAKNTAHSIYSFTQDPIDVVIPCVGKDLPILERCIEGIKTYGANINRVIVVSPKHLTDNAEWFDEKLYPFNKQDVALYLFKGDSEAARAYVAAPKSRVGWYFQQLLKLYAPFVIPNLSSNVLVLDADTVFLNPVEFLNAEGGGLYNIGTENNRSYFTHAKKLSGGKISRTFPKISGISHHMLFQKPVLEDLFSLVESVQKMPFWQAFCTCVSDKNLSGSGASEYEIYFNFVFSQTKQVTIRPLKWENVPSIRNLDSYKTAGYHYVSCHSWGRK